MHHLCNVAERRDISYYLTKLHRDYQQNGTTIKIFRYGTDWLLTKFLHLTHNVLSETGLVLRNRSKEVVPRERRALHPEKTTGKRRILSPLHASAKRSASSSIELNNFAYISFWSARFLPPVVGGDKRAFQMTFYCRRERSRSLRLARFGRGNGFRGSMSCRGAESENAKRDIVIRIDNSSACF